MEDVSDHNVLRVAQMEMKLVLHTEDARLKRRQTAELISALTVSLAHAIAFAAAGNDGQKLINLLDLCSQRLREQALHIDADARAHADRRSH